MAQFTTKKRTANGKAQTLQRKAQRAVKYAARDLDLTTLARA